MVAARQYQAASGSTISRRPASARLLLLAAGMVMATKAATAPVGSLSIPEMELVNAWLKGTAQRKETRTASKATRFVIALPPGKKLGGMRH